MNRLESIVYSGLKHFPGAKDAIRTCYQAAMLPWLGQRHSARGEIHTAPGYFFGFHDKTPWCPENRRILAHKAPHPFEPGSSAVEVGYFEDDTLTTFTSLGVTEAWSKQQGSQLQWCGDTDHVIYNARADDGSPCSVRCDGSGTERRSLRYPVGAINRAGTHGCIVEFGAFGIGMEGYGYGEWAESSYQRRGGDGPATGLTEVNVESGAVIPHLELDSIADRVGWSGGGPWHTFLSHPQYSPSGSRLAFFVRRSRPGRRVQSQMCVFDKTASSLVVMRSGDWVSHYCWLGDDELLVYLEDTMGRRLFQAMSALNGQPRGVRGLPEVDGHPNFAGDQSLLVVDSYADRRRRQTLTVFRFDGVDNFEEVEQVRFYSPLRFRNENRVDLHPRWDRAGVDVCVDSSFSGQRSLSVIKGNPGW